MRLFSASTLLTMVALGLGCNSVPFFRPSQQAPGLHVASATPSAAELVSSLNDNARRVQILECRDVDLDCTKGWESVGLRAVMICQKPKNFRMSAKVMGNTAVDMGSNNHEFWYWISKAEPPYLFHCSYDDFARGQARMPFPFQPEWIMEALGIADYDPSKAYEVAANGNSIDLIEKTLSPQGQPVRKITRLSRSANHQIQVTGHILQDSTGRELCSAIVAESQKDAGTGAILPRQVQLVWPAEQIRMKMRFDRVAINSPLSSERTTVLFTRPTLRDVPSYDLARGLDAAATGLRPAAFR
jgi:hypothetical protein